MTCYAYMLSDICYLPVLDYYYQTVEKSVSLLEDCIGVLSLLGI